MLSYHRSGSGQPLLLLHGIGSHWKVWTPVLGFLEPHYDVIAVDLPGCGTSPPPAAPVSIDGTVAALTELLDDLGVDVPHVAGNSYGGWLALEMGCRSLARSVTALAPSGPPQCGASVWTLTCLRLLHALAGTPDPALRFLLRARPGRALAAGLFIGHPQRLTPQRLLEEFNTVRDCTVFWDLYELHRTGGVRTEQITCPVTVAFGSRDWVIRPGARRRIAVPSAAQWVSLAGCGHVPPWDDPAAVAEAIDHTAQLAPTRYVAG